MNKKARRQLEKLFSIPKCFIYKIMGFGRVKISGLQRWERGAVLHAEGGNVFIGNKCNFRTGVHIRALGGVLRIGDFVFANNNVSITAFNKITIGNHVKLANNVVIVDHDHDYMNGNEGYKVGSVVIEDGVWVGANSVILRDTHIGKNCVIAAGSVVKGNLPDNTVWGTRLAAQIKEFDPIS